MLPFLFARLSLAFAVFFWLLPAALKFGYVTAARSFFGATGKLDSRREVLLFCACVRTYIAMQIYRYICPVFFFCFGIPSVFLSE